MFGGNWFRSQQLTTPHKSKKNEVLARFDTTEADRIQRYLANNIYCYDMTHPASWARPRSSV